jgi:antitoxin component of RelBE/YafQ-DinJ toxin-antitoxin module
MGKTTFIHLRMTADEKRRITQAARRLGLSTSAWIRLVMTQAANGKQEHVAQPIVSTTGAQETASELDCFIDGAK